MFLKFKKIFLIFAVLFVFVIPVQASEKVNLYFFYGQGCPHCAKEEIFLDKLEKENQNLAINRYEVWNNEQNSDLLSRVTKELQVSANGVPLAIVGDQAIVGYLNEQTTGEEIKGLIGNYHYGVTRDVVKEVINNEKSGQKIIQKNNETTKKLTSIFGEIDIKKLSLPILTIFIGTLDSLNPCAMWVLLLLISLMLGMNDRKRMWILGGSFIIGSAAAYFVFMSAWLNIYLFISYLIWAKAAIILLAVIIGVLNLKKYWENRKGGCEVSENESKRIFITGKIRKIVESNKYWLAAVGIIILAVAINMVELLCSAGLPAVYIPILTEAGLVKSQYYAYLLLYCFFYVLIQIVVFLAAMFTLEIKAVSSKVTKWSSLIGGILMIAIGIYLISKWGILTIF